jgi:hypothetical protein
MRRQRSKAFDVQALLESERGIPAVPTDLRSRAVRRARRAVVEGRAVSIVAVRPARLRWAIAAASVLVLGALATAAIERRPRQVLSTIPDAAPSPSAIATSPRIAAPEPDLTSFEPPPRSRAGRPVRRVFTQAEEYARELRLLQPAREALARDDFDSALAATAAHERRFPHGQLVEEREALRIVALAGAQRGADARIAAAAFHQRFPSSLLQKRVDDALRGLP